MAATPKPIRKVIKKASSSHRKEMAEHGERHKQFGSPTKQETKAMLGKHEGRLKKHAKEHGQVAMPHHPNYNKSRAEKTKHHKHSKEDLMKAHHHMAEHMR